MANYTVTTNFGAKDSLPSGNAGKLIKGTEFTTEFNNIATAVATKADTTAVDLKADTTTVTALTATVATKLPLTGGTLTGNLALNTDVNPTVTIRNTDTSIAASQVVGTIEFRGDDDSGNVLAGHIQQVASGTWGIGNYGSDMVFSVKRGGTGGSFSEKLRLEYSGVKITSLLNIVPSAEPSSGIAGDIYYDSTSNKLRCYNGSTWNNLF